MAQFSSFWVQALHRSPTQDALACSSTLRTWPAHQAERAASRRCGRRRAVRLVTAAAGKQGGNVLDRPSTLPGIDWGTERKKKKPPIYRVMLHNDNFNRREYVVQVLLKVVDGMTVDIAVNVMQEAHLNGLAMVIACAQEDAEKYCEGLRANGLISSVEPAGPNGE